MPVDLFSDTQTKPGEKMRRVMATAAVGDEQRRLDPTVRMRCGGGPRCVGTATAGTVTDYHSIALVALTAVDVTKAGTFAIEELGPLAGEDGRSTRLRATLGAYLEEGRSPGRAASRLGVHENTVVNRLRAIREQLPHPLEDRTAELLVALRLAHLAREE